MNVEMILNSRYWVMNQGKMTFLNVYEILVHEDIRRSVP